MDLDDIEKVVHLMDEHGLTEFELVKDGTRLSLRRGSPLAVTAVTPAQISQIPSAVMPPVLTQAPEQAAAAPSQPDDKCVLVKAPFVGTFYRAPAPDADPYVAVGQEVNPDSVLCILEAMKVMNEIKAEVRGIIREILVENAQPVQFGQALFRIEPL